MSDPDLKAKKENSIRGTLDIELGWEMEEDENFDALKSIRRRCALEGQWNAWNLWFQLCINKNIFDKDNQTNVYHIFQHLDRQYHKLSGRLKKHIKPTPHKHHFYKI